MNASKRLGYSMFTGALLSGVLVAYESTIHHAKLVANAAQAHASVGMAKVLGFVAFTLVIGLLLYAITAARAQRRGSPAGQQARGYR